MEQFVYPATLVSATEELNASAMAAQHGTIADISANFDAATGSGNLVTNGTSCGTSEQVTKTNRALIGKFTPKYGGVAIDEITTLTVTDGNVTATASNIEAAGIGTGGVGSVCGNILISGGTVVATGSDYGPGIGAGYQNCTCGTITIGAGITSVTATRGSYTRTGDSSHTDPCIGAVVSEAVRNYCDYIYFGTSKMTTNKQTYYSPVTFLKWSPWPTSGSDYGGLHIEISNEGYTWTLTPATS